MVAEGPARSSPCTPNTPIPRLSNATEPTMHEALIDGELCDGCQDCMELCRYDAIDLVRIPPSKRMKAKVDPDRCCGCFLCAPSCPQHGIDMIRLGRTTSYAAAVAG